jgi:hypothetical protein
MLDMPSMTINPYLHPEISSRAVKAEKKRRQDGKTWIPSQTTPTWIQTAKHDLNPQSHQGRKETLIEGVIQTPTKYQI